MLLMGFFQTFGSDGNFTTGSIGNQNFTLQITGIQIEMGEHATPYEISSYEEDFSRCMRFFQSWGAIGEPGYSGTSVPMGNGMVQSTTAAVITLPFRTAMRKAPTLGFSATNDFTLSHQATTTSSSNMTAGTTTQHEATMTVTVASGLTAGNACRLTNTQDNVNGTITASAELAPVSSNY